MTTGWEVSERKGDRDQGEERLTNTSHIGGWSHCAAHKGEGRGENLASLWTFLVHECVHLCVCIFVCLYVNISVGESAEMIIVELEYWASGCMQWICLSGVSFESMSMKAAIHISVCKPSSCQWSDFEACVTGLPFQDHSLVCVYESLCEAEQKTHCESHCTRVHMYVSARVFVSLWFSFDFGFWEIYKQQGIVQLCQQWTPGEGQTSENQELIWPQYGLPAHFAVTFKLLDSFCKRFIFATDIRRYDIDEKQKTDAVNWCKSVHVILLYFQIQKVVVAVLQALSCLYMHAITLFTLWFYLLLHYCMFTPFFFLFVVSLSPSERFMCALWLPCFGSTGDSQELLGCGWGT